MALRYIESISSMSAESLNSLRKNFTKLMKTGLELEVFTALVNKNLTDFIYEAMLKAGQAEKMAYYGRLVSPAGLQYAERGIICKANTIRA